MLNHKPTILIADDDPVITKLLSFQLSRAGYAVVIAYDGMQAVMMAMRCNPACVLLDLNMPAGTGLQVIRRLKASLKTTNIPILVISATIESAHGQDALSLGAHCLLPKPVDVPALLTIISEQLGYDVSVIRAYNNQIAGGL